MWPDPSPTQELLHRLAEGEEAALERLLERHRPALRQMIEMRMDRMLRRRVDASDIVQDVLVEANRRLPEYLRQRQLPFHLWLRQIARDRMIDAHRRHRGAERRSLDREQHEAVLDDRSAFDLVGQLMDRQATPATDAIRREMAQRFEAALVRLEPRDREVILMRHFEHLSNQETAQALGLTEPAAGMRYLRALRKLKALLQEAPSQQGGS